MDNSNPISETTKRKDYDVFKDSSVRYLGYANEVGESFRVVVPLSLVRLSYVISSTYVFCDAVHKGHQAFKKSQEKPKDDKTTLFKAKKSAIAFGDTLVWQGLASVIIPGFTINRICWATRLGLKKIPSLPQPLRYWAVVGVGLACIPAIISPIDTGVHIAMDKTLRTLYEEEDQR